MNSAGCPFAVGEVLRNSNPSALARRVRVTSVQVAGYAQDHFEADVLEGENTKDPLKVYRSGWWLYLKVIPEQPAA